MFHDPILFYSISVTNKETNSNNIIDVVKSDSVLQAVINWHWFEWRFSKCPILLQFGVGWGNVQAMLKLLSSRLDSFSNP